MLRNPSAGSATTSGSVTQCTIPLTRRETDKFKPLHPRQQLITDKVVSLIAGTQQPLALVETVEFQDLLNTLEPRYTVPSRSYVSILISSKYEELRQNAISLLKLVPSISITVDIWSSRQTRSFLGMTAHFIHDWRLHSLMLACRRFKGRHTAENIFAHFDEVVNYFNISHKVSYVISDNASNMIKAFSIAGPRVQAVQVDRPDSSSGTESESDDSLLDGQQSEDNDSLFSFLPEHDPCFSHTLQLVVKDGMKEAGPLKRVISKVSSLVSHVRKSTHATDLPEGEARLQTRWHSEVTMIKYFLKIPQEKLDKLETSAKLTYHDRCVLSDLVSILTPFAEATNFTQGQNIVTASYVIPCVVGLKLEFSNMQSRYTSQLASTLKQSIQARLTPYEQRSVFCLAAALDPRFKLKWCTTSTMYDSTRKLLTQEAHKSLQETTCKSETSNDTDTQTAGGQTGNVSHSPPRKKSQLFSFMATSPRSSQSVLSTTPVETEIREYLETPCTSGDSNPLEFWKGHEPSYPILSRLAKRYLSVPASSAPVERIFSIGGKIFGSDRCRLSDKKFEMLMFIKNNGQLPKVK